MARCGLGGRLRRRGRCGRAGRPRSGRRGRGALAARGVVARCRRGGAGRGPLVAAVEVGDPAAAAVARVLDEVAQAAARLRLQGGAGEHDAAVRMHALADPAHGAVAIAALVMGEAAAGVDPVLAPDADRRVVVGDAGPRAAALRAPALLDQAAAEPATDAAGAHQLAASVPHLPIAEPEVELAALGAGGGGVDVRLRQGRGGGGDGAQQNGDGEPAVHGDSLGWRGAAAQGCGPTLARRRRWPRREPLHRTRKPCRNGSSGSSQYSALPVRWALPSTSGTTAA